MNEILSVSSLTKRYGTRTAVDNASFSLYPSEHLGIEGHSGSGKTTLMKCVMGIVKPDSGTVRVSEEADRPLMQMIFQDPGTTLNPFMTARDIIMEGARYHHLLGKKEDDYLLPMLESVSLSYDDMSKKAGEFSGGEKARIAIARALAMKPRILIADEITSSLDASLRASILSLLSSLDLALIFISHDALALECISDRILYMEGGRLYDRNSR